MISNESIAQKFDEIATLLEIKGENAFKIRAYRIAATTIKELSYDLAKVHNIADIEKIPGIGKGLAGKILEIVQSGDCEYYCKLIKEIPRNLIDLLQIEGLGPKRVATMYHKLGITNIQDLATSVQQGKLLELSGFGEKIVNKIIQGIKHFNEHKSQFLLADILPVAQEIIANLSQIPGITHIESAGSLRRWKETVKDLDILVTGDSLLAAKVMDVFTSLPQVEKVLQKGETKSCVQLITGIQVDLRFVPSNCFGASMQYFSGSKEHNIVLRTLAREKGFKISEYGIFHIQTNLQESSEMQEICIASENEADIYSQLGMDYIEPELRENSGEIEAALQHSLPQLIQIKDIRGDCHSHTNQSDGRCTLEEMVAAAQAQGYEYMAITDHSQSSYIANGLNEERLSQWIQKIHAFQKQCPNIHLLAGIEVDILSDGSLDIQDNVLKQCDIVVASVHANFRMSREEMTQRIKKALSHPLVNIFAHPTGRLIKRREPYSYDFDQVLEVALQNQVAFEVNSQPERLDLKDTLIRRVVNRNGWLSIDSDAHSIYDFKNIILGVHTARRGWCTPQHCINTYSWSKLQEFLKKKKNN